MHHAAPPSSYDAPSPAVFLASLTDYVNGIVHGRWIDVHPGVTDLQGALDEILSTSPWARRTGEPAEEWILLDHEGFPGLRPVAHSSVDEIARLASTQALGAVN